MVPIDRGDLDEGTELIGGNEVAEDVDRMPASLDAEVLHRVALGFGTSGRREHDPAREVGCEHDGRVDRCGTESGPDVRVSKSGKLVALIQVVEPVGQRLPAGHEGEIRELVEAKHGRDR